MKKNQLNRSGFRAYLKTGMVIVKISILMFIIPTTSNAAKINGSLNEQERSKNEIAISSVADILKDGKGTLTPGTRNAGRNGIMTKEKS